MRQKVDWLNVEVCRARLKGDVSEGELYDFMAVLLMSHLTNLSMTATRSLLFELG